MYEQYAVELIMKEGVETALERSIMTMMEWAEENPPAPWHHYFNHVSLNRAVWHIKDGKISPWLMLNCASGKAMLGKFNDEQLAMVYHILNPEHWAIRFKRQSSDVQLVKEVAKESNL
jgi:CDP-glycerol glycerophosphotransferase (TagB/SpsB family)